MSNTKISIVIVTYNSSKTINKLIKSFSKGSNSRYINEIIIIENNSPDKSLTRDICKKHSTNLRISYYDSENVGFGRSCNFGAKMSKSKYILFLNPDTELLDDSLEILISHAIKSHSDITGGKAVDYSSKPHGSVVRAPNLLVGLFEFSNLGKIFHIKTGNRYFYYKDIDILNSVNDVKVDAVSGAYLLIKSDSFNQLNGFDKNIFMYLEDVDLGVRANRSNMKVIFCPHSVIRHVGGASSDNKYHISHQAWFDSRKYYYKKHFSLITNILMQTLFNIEEYILKILHHL